MKLRQSNSITLRGRRGFTLPEVLITCTILVILVGSVIMCNLFGLSMAARQQIWMSASTDAAQAVSTLMNDIRSGVTVQVGTFQTNGFLATPSTNTQVGNALMIFTNNTATLSAGPWICYYYDSTSNNLIRTNYYGGTFGGDYKLVSANPITNDSTMPIFTAVDYTGTALASATSTDPAIQIYLSFTKLQDPQIVIENGSTVDLYQLIATVTPRSQQ
jgi:prepilin-type N-terminal cleavage/methylation domain-containing protein